MIKYYKLVDKETKKDVKFNNIRFWINKIDANDLFPCYPEQQLDEIMMIEKIEWKDITNDKNYVINVNSLNSEGMCEIKFHDVDKVFDYFAIQSFNDNKNDWYFFYLDQENFMINNLQKESCTTLFVLDQWMTFGCIFHDILKNSNPEVKFLRKFKNRFICNKSYKDPEQESKK